MTNYTARLSGKGRCHQMFCVATGRNFSAKVVTGAVTGAASTASRVTPCWLRICYSGAAIILAVGMTIDVVALPVGCAGILGVGGVLTSVGSVDSRRAAAESDVDLAIDMGSNVGDGGGTADGGCMAFGTADGVMFARIDMPAVASGCHDIRGGIVGLMTSFACQAATPGGHHVG